MQLTESVNLNEIDDDDYSPLPDGVYHVRIKNTEVKQNKKRNGEHIAVTFEVIEDQFNGRLVFDSINYLNESNKAQAIGRKRLKQLCAACGLSGDFDNTSELDGAHLLIEVTIEPGTNGYKDRNAVERFIELKSTPILAKDKPEIRQAVAFEDDEIPF